MITKLFQRLFRKREAQSMNKGNEQAKHHNQHEWGQRPYVHLLNEICH